MICEHPDGSEARLPALGTELAGLEVVRPGQVRTRELEPGWRRTERKTVLRGFRPGGYTVGPLEVILVPEEGRSGPSGAGDKLSTGKVQLELTRVAGEGSSLDDLKPLKGPFELPPEPRRWGAVLAVGLGALAVLALVGFGLRVLAVRRVSPAGAEAARPPHEIALEELESIRKLGLLEQGRVSEYTDKVSDVLRRYLEARFALPAPERTTEEFLDEVARTPVLDRDRKRFLAEYLARCDLVKFAAAEPGRRELDELFESSVRFVEETALVTRGA